MRYFILANKSYINHKYVKQGICILTSKKSAMNGAAGSC